ncbi:tRNA-splicing endonuclease subunit sen54 [Chytridiales sp. JEL 0842]|nr:tRNA-splicing endonuclease subunit sen54 [Chytridiales sp. JEL 0842]
MKRSARYVDEDKVNEPPEEDDQEDQDVAIDYGNLLNAEDMPTLPSQTSSSSLSSSSSSRSNSAEPTALQVPQAAQLDPVKRSIEALRVIAKEERKVNTKSITLAIWHPEKNMASILKPRGAIFDTIGFNSSGKNGAKPLTWLYPEEALFLVERGTVILRHKEVDDLINEQLSDDVEMSDGVKGGEGVSEKERKENQSLAESLIGSMSLQQAYTNLIGINKCSLEQYQVYAHLKRVGYIVYRSTIRRELPTKAVKKSSFVNSLISGVWDAITIVALQPFIWIKWSASQIWRSFCKFVGIKPPPKPILLPTFAPVSKPLVRHADFDVYKPGTPFKKASRPQPHFHLAVVRSTDPVMDAATISTLISEAPQGTEVKVAVVEQGLISFISLAGEMPLPDLKSSVKKKKRNKKGQKPPAS